MEKRIAVLVRDRQFEAMRMAIGITLMDDLVDVYLLDRKIEDTENNSLNLEMMQEMKMPIYTNCAENCSENREMKYLPAEEIAHKLTGYDHVLAY